MVETFTKELCDECAKSLCEDCIKDTSGEKTITRLVHEAEGFVFPIELPKYSVTLCSSVLEKSYLERNLIKHD